VDRETFATTWAATGNHRFASLIHDRVGDVTWYPLTLSRPGPATTHVLGYQVAFVRSSLLHRTLWSTFYARRWSWRLRPAYRTFAGTASYLAPLSTDLLRKLRRDRPEALFVQDYSSGRFDVLLGVARMLRAPLIAYHSGSTPDSYVGGALRRFTLRRADAVIVSSHREADHVSQRFGVAPSRCHVVLTPIDLEVFRPLPRAAAMEAAGLDENKRYFLYVGRLDDDVKRVTNLIRAFKEAIGDNDEIELVIVGDGPDGEKIRRQGEDSLGDQARFLGWVSDPVRLAQLYSCAEATVLPSLHEGFPTIVGESLACGTPVIASDVGGVPELVTDGVSGRLVPPGDDRALAKALSEAIADPVALESMRLEARRIAEERVAPALLGDALLLIFKDALESRRA
jgi:glycosyltransferase involved in cell wall biosynthesis